MKRLRKMITLHFSHIRKITLGHTIYDFFLFELITAKKMERRDTRDVCGILRIYAEESDYYHDLEKFSSWKTRSSEWKGGCAEEYEEEKIFKKTTYSTTYGECGILLLKN